MRHTLIVMCMFLSSALPALPQDKTAISLTIMASRISWSNSQYVGHAFLCVGLQLNSGIKEDCLGFYPASQNIKSFIGGPGVVDKEFGSKHPDHWANVSVSVQKNITPEQRRRIYALADEYNSKHYDLTDSNCVDFVDKIAEVAGWRRPPRSSIQFPVDYVAKLKELSQ